MELETVKGFEYQALHHRELDVNPIGIACLSSHEDYENRVLEE